MTETSARVDSNCWRHNSSPCFQEVQQVGDRVMPFGRGMLAIKFGMNDRYSIRGGWISW